MPRIRKKTSKRGTSNQRGRIRQKVAETRKKRKKEAKKNPQWKSKQRKDLEIPNNFPYKDQLLAEMVEQRIHQMQQKQDKKLKQDAGPAGDREASELDAVLLPSSPAVTDLTYPSSTSQKLEASAAHRIELPNLDAILDVADIVVEVLDSRDPLSFRTEHLEKRVGEKGKRLVLLLNKIDLCPRESVQAWLNTLGSEYPVVPFSSCRDSTSPDTLITTASSIETFWSLLQSLLEDETPRTPPCIALVGLTNVGKSSVLNSLVHQQVSPIYELGASHDGPSTTIHPLEVASEVDGRSVQLIDTPGVVFASSGDSSEDSIISHRARDILLRNKGRIDKLKDPVPVVADVVSRATREDLMLYFNIPAFNDGDVDSFLTAVARSHGFIKNHGTSDTASACRLVLKDWNNCKLPYYTVPSSNASAVSQSAHMEILNTLKSRKDWRRSTGIIKLRTGMPDSREVSLKTSWLDDDDEVDADESDELADGAGEDEVEASDYDEDDDGGAVNVPGGKRKFRPSQRRGPPAKKVTFATLPARDSGSVLSSQRTRKRSRP